MGCGAICGDSTSANTTATAHSINTMNKILPLLNKTSALANQNAYHHFIRMYRLDAKKFHFKVKDTLDKDEQISEDVLVRWKLVLYGLDSELKSYSNCLGLPPPEQSNQLVEPNEAQITEPLGSTFLPHECFSQIDKDLHRTFQLPTSRRKEFENVLKRIANFFPKIGYTQGMNFVVGFLIICGYSENDVFWIFVHVAINKRFLLLGLYQDGFPLNNVFCIVFKNSLRRTNEELYMHVFEMLMVDVSMWVFKWFMTCFVYSFPLEMGKYAWDVLIELGGLGIVAMALSITNELSPYLMQKEDMPEISQFLKELSEVETFNHYVNIESVIRRTYEIEFIPDDFQGTEETGGFYGTYYKANCASLQRHLKKEDKLPTHKEITDTETMLDKFYQKLFQDRVNFMETHKNSIISDLPLSSPEKFKKSTSQTDLFNLVKDQQSTAHQKKVRKGSSELSKSEVEWRKRVSYPIDRINEHIEQESRSAISKLSQQFSDKISHASKHSHVSKKSRQYYHPAGIKQTNSININDLDELDRFQREYQHEQELKKSVKFNNYAAPDTGVLKVPSRVKKVTSERPESDQGALPVKINGSHNIALKSMNTFTLTGQNVLNIDGYDAVSISSKNASNKSKNVPQQLPKGNRSCACKIKTQEHKISGCDKRSNKSRSSELASSKDQFSDKESLSNRGMSHTEENMADLNMESMQNVQTHRERVQTEEHVMAISHGPQLRGTPTIPMKEKAIYNGLQGDIDVEVLPFKKVKKTKEGRVSII